MATDKKQTLKQILDELPTMDNNLREFSRAILDCTYANTYQEMVIQQLLTARSEIRTAQIYIEHLEIKK